VRTSAVCLPPHARLSLATHSDAGKRSFVLQTFCGRGQRAAPQPMPAALTARGASCDRAHPCGTLSLLGLPRQTDQQRAEHLLGRTGRSGWVRVDVLSWRPSLCLRSRALQCAKDWRCEGIRMACAREGPEWLPLALAFRRGMAESGLGLLLARTVARHSHLRRQGQHDNLPEVAVRMTAARDGHRSCASHLAFPQCSNLG